jgi:hypothetical protein
MRKSLLLIFIISLLLLVFCGKNKDASGGRIPAGKTDNAALNENDQNDVMETGENMQAPANPAEASAEFAIKECAYSPENPTAFDDVTVTPVLNDVFANNAEVLKDVTFEYRWIVNNKEIAVQGNMLEKSYFKKKDWVQCRVRGFLKGRKTPEFRAKVISIQNAPPVVDLQPVAEFAAPGEFTYQIKASDPDNDPLTFSLIAPLDLGITLNSETGLFTWPVDRAQAKKTEAVEIKFSVSDPDGGKVEASIKLNFSSKQPVMR